MEMCSRKIAGLTVLILVAFAGCAQAPSFDEEAFLVTGGDNEGADSDAGTLDAGPGGLAGGAEAGVIGGFTGGDQGGGLGTPGNGNGGLGGSSDSGGLGSLEGGPEAGSSVADAGRANPVADSGVVGSPEAGQSAPEAGSGTPGGGPMCNPAACNNDCFLLERCCNANNECACLTPLSRECSLPSL